ncbi:NADPH:quinone oxidoreductase family protein [Halobacillus aidingensis]|uniref:Putative quinone oxidoreductase, YhdH/YhfP family n=1 Tax=Halobacillus aidingensis TaxID=240303 RepID=A0A1H0G378_HALAD|nr:acryloyl-CoA reductase [Halobacillus aidingensis]SDO01291.1 putative quinone oxidoreductase, YhdH/YhfP family [Halobacillus aidingensis]
MTKEFKALVVNKTDEDFSVNVESLSFNDLPEGDVTIRVHYSSVNYKDGLASIPNGKIVQSYPFVPGIDLAGTVVSSDDDRYQEGDEVVVTSYELGVSHYGGYSEYARVPGDWVVPLPENMSLKEAMAFGTAGFTAALSVHRLEESGVTPEDGTILVTGATGGVGSMAVSMLAKRGYHVTASTGKESEHEYLKTLGSEEIISREEVTPEKIRPIGKQKWAGVVDPVGGKTLASVLSNTKYGGAVAVSGLTAGVEVPTTVFPFILRGVNLLGIDSVYCPKDLREKLWKRMAADLKPDDLGEIENEVTLKELPDTLSDILQGKVRGRTVVNILS